ncbi:MAG: DUF2752 domain-containing protein [Clostridium sp.]|uniref:DUF2752 domain-containing protein n=1 Tax=Clostridium sp. TaxID=1506 RepID=UPI003F3F5F60
MRRLIDKIIYTYKMEFNILVGLIFYVFLIGDCVVKKYTGMPCPTCGISRATINFFIGNFKESFEYHLLLIPFIITVCVYLFQKWIQSKNIYFKYFYISMGVVFILYYIFRMYYLFPNIEPMDYNFNSKLYKIISYFKG